MDEFNKKPEYFMNRLSGELDWTGGVLVPINTNFKAIEAQYVVNPRLLLRMPITTSWGYPLQIRKDLIKGWSFSNLSAMSLLWSIGIDVHHTTLL